jgi:hypothetical protein
MRGGRELIVPIVVTLIAVLVIVGGYASFSGLATYSTPLSIEMAKKAFKRGDVFDANILVNPVTLLADESIMIYVDNNAVGAVAIKRYLDDNRIEYGTEFQNLGQNSAEVMNLKNPLQVNLADFITLEGTLPGTTHVLKVEFSRGDASAEEVFSIE